MGMWQAIDSYAGGLGGMAQRASAAFGWEFVLSIFLLYGVGMGVGRGFSSQAQSYFALDTMGLSSDKWGRLLAFAQMPWQVKPMIGFLSDVHIFACFSKLRRSPYVIFGSLCVTGSVINLYLCASSGVAPSMTSMFFLLFFGALGTAFIDVIGDASVAEHSLIKPELTADLQGLVMGSSGVTGMPTSFIGSMLLQSVGTTPLFLLSSIFSFASLVPGLFQWLDVKQQEEDEADTPQQQQQQSPEQQQQQPQQQQQQQPSPRADEAHAPGGDATAAAAVGGGRCGDECREGLSGRIDSFLSTEDHRHIARVAFIISIWALILGFVELFFGETRPMLAALIAQGGNVGICIVLYLNLRRVDEALARAALFMYLSSATSPSSNVAFEWAHMPAKEHSGSPDYRCYTIDKCAELTLSGVNFTLDDANGLPCGWATERRMPCISPMLYSYLDLVTTFMFLVGAGIYTSYCQEIDYRKIIGMMFVLGFLSSLSDIAFFSRLNLDWGVSDKAFLFGSSVIMALVFRLYLMPMFTFLVQLCHSGIEGTMFALFMGLSNFGGSGGTYLGSSILTLLGGVKKPEFDGLIQYAWITAICNGAQIAMVPFLVPRGTARHGVIRDPPTKTGGTPALI